MFINKKRICFRPKPYVSDKKKIRQKAYASVKWLRLRDAIFMQQPICYLCNQDGIVTPTENIHHIISPFKDNGEVDLGLMYDPWNCVGLCEYHHGKIHGEHLEDTLYDIYYNKQENITEEDNGEDETI